MVLKTATPVMISMVPTIRPPGVIGYLSPYPTVAIVTMPHQSASPGVVMLALASGRSK